MSKEIKAKDIKKNVLLSVFVQAISLIVSFILNLILPKFISELDYSYWQAYVLYAGYVGILHFGILDGIVLRYSEFDYDELDKPRIRSQFVLMLVFYTILSLLAISISYAVFDSVNRKIFTLVAVAIISKNVFTYTAYTFQITNRINKYAILVLSQRLFYGVFIVVFLLLKIESFTV